MSFNWSRFKNIGKHFHTPDQIVSAPGTPAAVVNEEGGGGVIAVTAGGTTVENVTEIELVGSTVTDEGGGVAGVAVQTRLLGPFPVLFSNPALPGGGILVLTTLSENQIVLAFRSIVRTEWITTSAILNVEYNFESTPDNWTALWGDNLKGEQAWSRAAAASASVQTAGDGFDGILPTIIYMAQADGVRVGLSINPGVGADPTAGELDAFVLIAEPVA